jgi:hypothetical protein
MKKMNSRIKFLTNIYVFILFILLHFKAFSSDNIIINSNIIDNKVYFEQAYKENSEQDLPYFIYRFQTNNNNFSVEINNIIYRKLEIKNANFNLIKPNLIIDEFISKSKKEILGNVIINPYKINAGQVEIISSFDIKIIENGNNLRTGETSINYTSNSILSNGKWYKFGVSKAAIHKLDYNFLKQLGVDMNNINPNNIRIFGHEGGMLPELAGANRTDDLKEYAIKVISANNNLFQNGDYILVYTVGPNTWKYDYTKQQFKFTKHLYSNTQNLFLTTDLGTGKRISTINGNAISENYNATTYDAIAFVEDETENIAFSGRIFVGDRFVNQTNKNYAFSFPNIISNQALKIWTNVVAASTSSSVMQVSDGSNTRNINLSPLQQEYQGIFSTGMPQELNFTFANPSNSVNLNYTYQTNDFSGKAYLDFINVQARCNLVYNNTPLYFRDIQSVATARKTKFTISNINSNVEIWDITNPFDVIKINYATQGNNAYFIIETDSLREFVAFENTVESPIAFGAVSNQNLHALTAQDYIVITRKKLLSYAEEIAQLHRDNENLRTVVVDLEQVYNEFSSGTNDITAIRNFVKMFYDRAIIPQDFPKYLLLFGDGTFKNMELGEYYLPTYQSKNTFKTLQTYTSDDYFGILDDHEGNNIDNTALDLIDIGVGRIPADNAEKASVQVNKIKSYYASSDFGDWRSQLTFIADDEDNNLHFNQADNIAESTKNSLPKYNIEKIYLDAFTQQNAISGSTYPAANIALNSKIANGTLLVNYIGHGGGGGLAQEALVTLSEIENWNNNNKLPLFITATCEFSRYDEYDHYSAGERILFKNNSGAIALVSTTRLVFANENFDMNRNFMQQISNAANLTSMNIGDIIAAAKRNTFTGDGNRKFSLFGDPALRLAYPKNNVVITGINNLTTDTLKALKSINIKGEVRNNSNTLISDFDGIATITIYDKAKTFFTLANDASSSVAPFQLQKNKIIRAKTSVGNGQFQLNFIVPKDIDYNFGTGKISAYANSNNTDALGIDTNIIIGGIDTTNISDNKGPDIEVYLNDENFVFAGITDENPKLLLNLFDENGINTSGNGVGHDITAILDNNTRNIFNLNDYYEPELNNLKNGKVTFPLSNISKGRHTLNIKAWDILNNSGEGYTEFLVEESAKLAISHVLNYPNPFTSKTTFMFEHNKPNQELDLKIEIFSMSGKIVKTITQDINATGYRVSDIVWDGKDDFGDNIGRGVYVYKVSLKDKFGGKVSQYQKLVILK